MRVPYTKIVFVHVISSMTGVTLLEQYSHTVFRNIFHKLFITFNRPLRIAMNCIYRTYL